MYKLAELIQYLSDAGITGRQDVKYLLLEIYKETSKDNT